MSESAFPPPPSAPPPPPPAAPASPAAVPRRGPPGLVAAILAWVFPGLGHFAVGRRGTSLLYALIVTATFLLGMSFEGRLYSPEPGQPLTILATFAVYGAGLLNVAARLISTNPSGSILSVTYEYGCAFLLTAGLMNLLLMLDAYDIATGRK
ncbi:MAG TPA: DUF6677 family protein [Thermoanaerobaculia bacterium]|nr:DUF6677 family protein [Thermoanaerobaculia bacterium]